MKVNRYLKLSLSFLFFWQLVGASVAIKAQQEGPKDNSRGIANKNACSNAERARLSIKCKERYFFGETPTVAIVVTNTSRSPKIVKEAEHQKFSLEMTGIFQNDAERQKKTLVYDGSWDLPKEPTRAPKPGEMHEWLPMGKREPKFVTLGPGESTNLELDLAKTFRSYLGVSKYKLAVKSEDGKKVVKEFEVYFDDEKSVAVLAKMLESDDESERNWAVSNLAKFNRARFVVLLEALAKAGNEKQRDFASGMLAQTKAGWFDSLKLRVENKDRYLLGETPIIAISIKNGSSTPKIVKEAEGQKFLLELRRFVGNDSKQEIRTCVYDGNEPQRKPNLVTLAELDSTTLSLNLTKCFGTSFDVGKYELMVRAADEGVLKHQKVVKKFEVYFDEQKSVKSL